jgi:hypothetical protein
VRKKKNAKHTAGEAAQSKAKRDRTTRRRILLVRDDETMSGEIKTVERLKANLVVELQLTTPAELRTYWKRVTWPKTNLVALVKKQSPLGCALRWLRLSNELLVNGSKQPDPFGWLLERVDVTKWTDDCRAEHATWMTRVWLAAASQLRAERRLIHKAHGWADTWEELRQRQHRPDKLRFADEFYFAQLAHANERRRAELVAIPGLEERLTKARQENDGAFLRRFRRTKAEPGKRAGVSLAEVYAVQHWLELPRGLPGLCFFSDDALHSLLEIFGLTSSEGLATKQVRVRLGLIQSGAKRHLVEQVIASDGKLRLTGSMMAKPFSFEGTVSWNGRRLWPSSR